MILLITVCARSLVINFIEVLRREIGLKSAALDASFTFGIKVI
jgi:hypothetical protein